MRSRSESERICVICFISMLLNGLYATMGSLVMPLLRDELGFGYDRGGLLLSALNVGNVLACLLCGAVTMGLGRKGGMALLTLCSVAGYLLLWLGRSYALMLPAFFMIGLSKGSVYRMDNVLLPLHARDKRRSMSFFQGCFAAGAALCAPLIALVGSSWRTVCLICCLLCCSLPVLFATRRLGSESGQPLDLHSFKRVGFWLVTLTLFFEIATETAVSGWVVSYFKDGGLLTGRLADWTLTINWVAMLAARFFFAFHKPRLSAQALLCVLSAASVLFLGVTVVASSAPVALIGLIGFSLSVAGVQPIVLANSGAANQRAGALSLILPLGSIGGVVMPAVTGLVSTGTGIQGGMAAILAAAGLMLGCCMVLLKNPKLCE